MVLLVAKFVSGKNLVKKFLVKDVYLPAFFASHLFVILPAGHNQCSRLLLCCCRVLATRISLMCPNINNLTKVTKSL